MEGKKRKMRGRIAEAARIGSKTGFLETFDLLEDRTMDRLKSLAVDGEACR